MKELALLLLLANTVCFGQKIEGLSIFKLNKYTTEDLVKLAESENKKIKKCNDIECTSGGYSEYISKSENNFYPYSQSKNVRTFIFNDFLLNKKYSIKSLVLRFYKNKLYEIRAYKPSSELYADVKIKYGSGHRLRKEGVVSCSDKEISRDVKTNCYFEHWMNESENVIMTHYKCDTYSEDCKKAKLEVLNIVIDEIYNKVITESENEKRLEELKDL